LTRTYCCPGCCGTGSRPALLAELTDVIGRAKFDAILVQSKTTRERSLAEVRQLAEVVEPPPLPAPVCRDPDDDEVLALALAAKVDLIVSGDDDLLVLQVFEGIPILTPAQALQHVGVDTSRAQDPQDR
jgi:uncharacterized protein